MINGNSVLQTLERNRFYYGKLMDVRHWTVEQEYGIDARRLLSRLGLGTGVLCGLGVSIADDGCLWIEPGAAIDFAGREILVPDRICIQHPEQPTDCLGRADGDPVTDGDVTISLCYHECLAEPAPAIACGCDTVERCEAGIVQEKYCVRVDRGDPPTPAPFPCDTIYPAPPPDGFDRRHTIFDTLAGPCAPASDDCVVLATVAFATGKAPVVDPFTRRRTIYSNQALFELILCLAARVDACCKNGTPVAKPPRVTQMWPRDREILTHVQPERDSFIKRPRIEVAFEREMDHAAISDPDAWLRMWAFTRDGDAVHARRVGLTHADPPGIKAILTPGPGEELAVYVCDQEYRQELRSSRVLVQLRPEPDATRVVVDVSTPPLLLDGEHHGTSLSQAQLDDLWTNVSDPTQTVGVDLAIWDALLGPGAAFPTGEGTEGGNLDLGFAFDVPAEVSEPRLRAVWPPNAAYLRPHAANSDELRWFKLYHDQPHLELTFDDSIDVASLGNGLDTWVRLWWLSESVDPVAIVPRRLGLVFTGPEANPQLAAPSATVTLSLRTELPDQLMGSRPNHFVLVVRGDAASVDADFQGCGPLAAAAVTDLWDNDAWTSGTPSGPSSLGAQLFDGQPGGTAVFFFDYAVDA